MPYFSYQSGMGPRLGLFQGGKALDVERCLAQLTGDSSSIEDLLQTILTDREKSGQIREILTPILRQERALPDTIAIDPWVDFERAQFLPPIPRPGKVICIAGNYPDLKTTGRPKFPIVFLKPSGGVIGQGNPICLPVAATHVACEVELVIVIGKPGREIRTEDAAEYIAGYSIGNDLGDRELEKRTSQWTSGKMFPTFTPLGPFFYPADEVGDANTLEIETRINGRVVQKGNTAQMFFRVEQLVAYLSTLCTLEPGDVILTGSPKLMGTDPNPEVYLRPGDEVSVSIATLSTLTNPVIAA